MSKLLPEVVIVASLSFFIGSFAFADITFDIRVHPCRLVRSDSSLSIWYTGFGYSNNMVRYVLRIFINIMIR